MELKSNSHEKSLNDNYMLLIFSVPYLYDLIVGIVSYIFVYKISNFNEIIRQSNKIDLEKVQDEINYLKRKYIFLPWRIEGQNFCLWLPLN